MEPAAFQETFAAIVALDASEGPSRNIFEPKFEARDKVIALQTAVRNSWKADRSMTAQRQLCRIAVFMGTNLYETEEDKEADVWFRKAFAICLATVKGESYDFEAEPAVTWNDILQIDAVTLVESHGRSEADLVMEVLNSIGVYLSSREAVLQRMDDARKVLHVAERCFDLVGTQSLEDGKLLEKRITTTYFCLAQVYSSSSDVALASKYCHLTMVQQLQSKLEFNRKDWATNAVHLAGFFAGEQLFGPALHCMGASKSLMPTEPADEETQGVVIWGYAKIFKALLRAGVRATKHSEGAPKDAPAPDTLGRCKWWVDFPIPGLQPPQEVQLPRSLDAAKEVFKQAVQHLQQAATLYTFENCCPDHIAIHQDIAECYKLLIEFDPDVERQAAMQKRRIDAIAPFPDQLSFQAYATLIRQLLFDLGDSSSDLFDLRLHQKQSAAAGSKPLSDKKINELAINARAYFIKFLDTFLDPKTKTMPTRVDKDAATAVFRALMRVARLEGKVLCKSPEEEYHVVGNSILRYEQVVKFVEDNDLASDATLAVEIGLAREMKQLLPTKQRDLRRAFASSTA